MLIILYQILQLHIKHSCLNLIQTTVTTSILEYILLLTAIVGQSTYCRSKLRIISGYCTTITKSTKVLTWIEAMTCCITNRTGNSAISELTAMTLSTVLHKFQVILFAKLSNLLSISDTTI